LSHFISSGYGKEYQDKFGITVEQYQRVVNNCKEAHPDLNIVYSVAHDRDDCCRIISSDGHLLQPTEERLVDLGSLVSISEKEMIVDFDGIKNEYFLRKTYLEAGNVDGR